MAVSSPSFRRFELGWCILLAIAFVPAASAGAGPNRCPDGLLPDLQTAVPHHLQIQNTGGREYLRVSNAIANRGQGPWHMHSENQLSETGGTTTAVQDVWTTWAGPSDPNGRIACSFEASTFAFHPEHNPWHIGDVALFEFRLAADNGTGGSLGSVYVNDLGQAQSFKTTFCLIDWVKVDDNARTPERTYWACDRTAPYQGISVGWMDQYHQSLQGQEIDITGAPAGIYYLVSTANDSAEFIESNYDNNRAWVSLRITRDSKGNAKFTLISHSPCDTVNMCGEGLPNR